MTEVLEQAVPATAPETDLVAAVHVVLQSSAEPLTLSGIRAKLPSRFRQLNLEELAEVLRRQVAANALQQYPKYRSQQDRFWDRPMAVHVADLLRQALEAGPLGYSELRRKLPAYAQPLAEAVLNEQLTQGLLHRHPRAGNRGGERYGAQPPNPRDYLRTELTEVFRRLQTLGFTSSQLRAAALELLHEDEWATMPPPAEAPGATTEEAAAAKQQAPTASPAPEGAAVATNENPAGNLT
jgi:hypothetical protein